MSGVLAIFKLDGVPVTAEWLQSMASHLQRRGPDGVGLWRDGAVGLGHTLLASTPELLRERQPLLDTAAGCVISADVRLDNRDELLAALGLVDRAVASAVGDAGLILAAYLAWGEACVEHLLGDFAFALWDGRARKLFCARDQFGMRPFYYHHAPGRLLTVASAPRAILALEEVPYRLNEGRIADFLITQLEGIDKTSTFFEELYRLPPAHTLTATPEGVRVRRYWTLAPEEELRLPSDEAYAEAFLALFTEAVRCRLRGAGPVGAMLSGGMDSGAVVAVARGLLAAAGQGPLPTFSAVGPDPHSCVETGAIHAALTMDGLAPHLVNHARLDELLPALADLTWELDEPFDGHMTLLRAVYLAARRQGLNILLDGAAGDAVLSEGSHLARLLRAGQWRAAYRTAVGQARFWDGAYPAGQALWESARLAFIPAPLRQLRRRLQPPDPHKRLADNLRASLISPEFARRVALAARLATLDSYQPNGLARDYGQERARALDHPYLAAGRERYDRVATAVAIEARDPFLDRRVVAFCLALPGAQKLDGAGWPKAIMRRAAAGRLPDAVRQRRGKQHLGWEFTRALLAQEKTRLRRILAEERAHLAPYVDLARLDAAQRAAFEEGDDAQATAVYEAAHLAAWLRRHARRPAPAPQPY